MHRLPQSIRFFWDRPYLLLVGATAMWGANTLFSRLAVNEISPMLLTFLRWVFVCGIAWLSAGKDLKEHWPVVKPKLLFIGLMGVIGFTSFNALMYAAAYHTTAVNISIIQGSIPIMVLLGGALVYHTSISWQQILGISITLFGVALIAFKGELSTLLTLNFNIGDLFMLAASLCYAVFTLALRNKPKIPGLLFFAILSTAAALSSFPLALYEVLTHSLIWPSLIGWSVTAAIVFFPSYLAQLFFIRSVEIVGPARASIFINLIPVFGTGFAIFFLRESLPLVQAAGLVMVLAGIWLAEHQQIARLRA